MLGWIVNLHSPDPAATREVDRDTPPVLVLDNGENVHEVWFFERDLQRWFVLASRTDPAMQAQGVTYFSPHHLDGGPSSVIATYVQSLKG